MGNELDIRYTILEGFDIGSGQKVELGKIRTNRRS